MRRCHITNKLDIFAQMYIITNLFTSIFLCIKVFLVPEMLCLNSFSVEAGSTTRQFRAIVESHDTLSAIFHENVLMRERRESVPHKASY